MSHFILDAEPDSKNAPVALGLWQQGLVHEVHEADWIGAHKQVRVLGLTSADRNLRVPTISFTVDGVDSQTIAKHVSRHKLGIRAGSFYALALGEAFDFARHNGVVRVSMVHYNTLEEVDRLTQHLDEAIGSSLHSSSG